MAGRHSGDLLSPSLVVKDFFATGETYPLADFVARSRTAFSIASRRVEEKYGFPCFRAMAQLARIGDIREGRGGSLDARVAVDAFEE